jgi:hypothetical protein
VREVRGGLAQTFGTFNKDNNMKTIRRDALLRAVKAGKMISVSSYHFDDMTGQEIRSTPLPARIMAGGQDFREGFCNLYESDFSSSCGYACENESGTFTLGVHSNCHYELALKPGETFSGAVGFARGRRPENVRMQDFLEANGIRAKAKYIPDGSMRGCWRLSDSAASWSMELAAKINALGFTNFDNEPLGQFSGNGSMFCVFVRGHNELIPQTPLASPRLQAYGNAHEKNHSEEAATILGKTGQTRRSRGQRGEESAGKANAQILAVPRRPGGQKSGCGESACSGAEVI